MNAPPLWPHQTYAVAEVPACIQRGERKICVHSPCGGGKTLMMAELLHRWVNEGLKTAIYTHRKSLITQLHRDLEGFGVEHGIRASGYNYDDSLGKLVQICSLQTENSKVFRAGLWQLHDADRVIVDEARLNTTGVAAKILETHYNSGASYVGFDATPVDLNGLYETLIVAGTNSELRNCGALLFCDHYAADEPDMIQFEREQRKAKKAAHTEGHDYTVAEQKSLMLRPGVFGRVLNEFRLRNPFQKPTILFGPDVEGSLWFAEQFVANGVPAAHIDGDDVWIDGKFYRANTKARDDVFAASKHGRIKVICNRYVCREGVNLPWLAHAILATIFGSIASYLQAASRILRAHPGLKGVTLSDHGGNWWRHGSINADREWSLDFTSSMVSGLRKDRLSARQCYKCKAIIGESTICINCGTRNEVEPMVCPKCKLVLNGPKCRACGYEIPAGKRSRSVVQSDGTLRQMVGDIFKPQRFYTQPNGPSDWERIYWRSRTVKGARTFKAAMALFAKEHYCGWPDRKWPYMPVNDKDFYKLVQDVPFERLVQP